MNELAELCLEGTCGDLLVRIDVGLHDDDVGSRAGRFLVKSIQPGKQQRSKQYWQNNEKVFIGLLRAPDEIVFKEYEEQDIYRQYPQCAARRAGVIIPLYPLH